MQGQKNSSIPQFAHFSEILEDTTAALVDEGPKQVSKLAIPYIHIIGGCRSSRVYASWDLWRFSGCSDITCTPTVYSNDISPVLCRVPIGQSLHICSGTLTVSNPLISAVDSINGNTADKPTTLLPSHIHTRIRTNGFRQHHPYNSSVTNNGTR